MEIHAITGKMRKILPIKYCSAVIVAAGSASRMGGIDKVMAPLLGEPMILRTVRTFQNSDVIREIVIVTRADLMEEINALCKTFPKVRAVVKGGLDRPASVQAGLDALSAETELVAIHDGARPLISLTVIDRIVRAAHSYSAAAPAVPVKDTIKTVKGGMVESTPNRDTLRAIQTPQVFDADLLRGALKHARDKKISVTDDCSAVEAMGMTVRILEGDERNLKITTPIDLVIAEKLLEETL